MGLAEPRKRLKISNDPNNLAWSQSAESYGQKLLSSQGWKPGQGLGARNAKHFNSSPVPKLAISYKDDTLGLGASLKSQDPLHTRTGLDAFQGLLGRLNGKSDVELEREAQKNEDRKLAMWAQGRWGGVMFVAGGTLVQGDGYKKADQEKLEQQVASGSQSDVAESNERARRKAEKKRLKEEKRRKREAGPSAEDSVAASGIANIGVQGAQRQALSPESNPNAEKTDSKETRKKKQERPTPPADHRCRAAASEKETQDSVIVTPPQGLPQTMTVTRTSAAIPRTGRHVIRGRNIEAKKMAFSDMKMLDQIFMVKG